METITQPQSIMKFIKYIGLSFFLLGIGLFTGLLFFGSFLLTADQAENQLNEKYFENLDAAFQSNLYNKRFSSAIAFSNAVVNAYKEVNQKLKQKEQWDKVMYKSPQEVAFQLGKVASTGWVSTKAKLLFWLSIGLAALGGILHHLPQLKLWGPPGIKNHHIYFQSATARGAVGILTGIYLIGFYILLYWFPGYIVNWVQLVDPLSMWISGNPASQWFLYGFLYTLVMLVMGIRMIIKYRNNKYQLVRTGSVMFFQLCFAFLIPEILVRFNKPYMDFKNIWPLDYDFFFAWNLNEMLAEGTLGLFMLVWGIALFAIGVPVLTYFYGKRWYCSWVCGCGGLAETLGDPYRHLSSKKLSAWRFERFSIHGVLVFAVFMTIATLYTYFSGDSKIVGIETADIQKTYGFLIGSAFAGVVGTGFYPFMGNRVWCRFGCPLAAYIGFVQRFKSRFRITTNGGQCISCGNCSTYCEMGIDVRWYAQRGQNIIRSSCVGCGICSAVCPRGVLKLENGPEKGRINDKPIVIGNEGLALNPTVYENE